jgi:hypothetical protein
MIRQLKEAPSNVAAFEATGEVTKDDFTNIVFPAVEKAVKKHDELNYLLLLNTELKNFTLSAWMQDALLGLKNIAKWRRVAIVTNSANIRQFTNVFSVLIPGEFRGFPKDNLQSAIEWVAAN